MKQQCRFDRVKEQHIKHGEHSGLNGLKLKHILKFDAFYIA